MVLVAIAWPLALMIAVHRAIGKVWTTRLIWSWCLRGGTLSVCLSLCVVYVFKCLLTQFKGTNIPVCDDDKRFSPGDIVTLVFQACLPLPCENAL